MPSLIKKHEDKVRFAIIGGINTLIDFGILFTLVAVGFPKIPSNIVSTSVALVFSFFANRKFTFKVSEKMKPRQLILFFAITFFGLWVIQPIIINGTAALLSPVHLKASVLLLIGKLLATCATLVWNFILYRKFVFKKAIS